MSDFQKQNVQWFPGHMAKTRRLIKESLPLVDCIVEILDARIPYSSRNPELSRLVGRKPRIVLLNKSDLADETETSRWLKRFTSGGVAAITVDCRSGKNLNRFRPLVREVLKEKIRADAGKGMGGKPLRVMVLGIPNTGKSSFINRMAGKTKAEVADKPGVTRSNRWFDIGGGVELLDTPGVLWPKFEDPKVGDKLAFIGSVKDEVIDTESIAVRLLKLLKENYPGKISSRYGVDLDAVESDYSILEAIALKRGMLLAGGVADTARASAAVLDEYRGGKLGRITLERADDGYGLV